MSYNHWMQELTISTQNGAGFRVKIDYNSDRVKTFSMEALVDIGDKTKWKPVAGITSFDAEQLAEFFTLLKGFLEYKENEE